MARVVASPGCSAGQPEPGVGEGRHLDGGPRVHVALRDPPGSPASTATVDWWKVDIEDAIQQYSIDYAHFLCYGTVHRDQLRRMRRRRRPRTACQNVERNQTNGGGTTGAARVRQPGDDLDLGYRHRAELARAASATWASGDAGLASASTCRPRVLDYYKTKASPLPFDVETDWAGTLGPNLTGTNPGAYGYRLITSFELHASTTSASACAGGTCLRCGRPARPARMPSSRTTRRWRPVVKASC